MHALHLPASFTLACALALGLVLGASGGGVSCAKGKPALGQATKPKLDQLRFADVREGRRHRALREWLATRSHNWRHKPLEIIGNFIEERWCGPTVSEPACEGGAVVNETARGTAWRTISTLHYSQDWPAVFGLHLSLGDVPQRGAGDLGVRFFLAENGAGIIGTGMSVSFVLLGADEKVPEVLTLGATQAYQSSTMNELQVEAPGSWQEELRRLTASPASLRETALVRLAALEARVKKAFAVGEIQGYDEGPYKGDGIPPLRLPRPLRPDERAAEEKRAAIELGRRRAFVEKHFAAMHARLSQVVPLDILLAP